MHRITCPACGQHLKYAAEHVGKAAKCQKCGHRFTLPAPSATDAPAEVLELPADDPQPAREVASPRPRTAPPPQPVKQTQPAAGRQPAPRSQRSPVGRGLVVFGTAACVTAVMACVTAFFWPYADQNPYVEARGAVIASAVPLDPDGTAYRPLRFAQLGLGWVVCGTVVGLVAVGTKPRGPAGGRPKRRLSFGVIAFAALLAVLTTATVYAVAGYDPYHRDAGTVVPVWRLSLSSPLETLNVRGVSEWKDPSARPFVLDRCPDPTTDPRVMTLKRNDGDLLVIPEALLDKHYVLPLLRVVEEAGVSPKVVEIRLVDRIPVGYAQGSLQRDGALAGSYYDAVTRSDYQMVKKAVPHHDGAGLIRTTTHVLPDAVGSDGKRYTLYFTKGVLEAVTGDGITYVQQKDRAPGGSPPAPPPAPPPVKQKADI